MDKYALLGELLRSNSNLSALNGKLMVATVKEITGESCTVDINGLEVTDVRLKATINESGNYLLLIPKVGSMVLLGSFSGDYRDLAVLKVDEAERIEYCQGCLEVKVDSVAGKFSVNKISGEGEDKQVEVGLYSILIDLMDLLENLNVKTPSGPSAGLVGASSIQLMALKDNIEKIITG